MLGKQIRVPKPARILAKPLYSIQMKRFLKFIIIIGIVGLTTIVLIYFGYLRFNYPSDNEFPIKGIDVSHHQNTIDWTKVKSDNIRFAFIKATEGGNFVDNRFQYNWKNAELNGIDVGAYHFFTFCRNPVDQARNFIKNVPVDKYALPPVIDLEFGGNCMLTKNKASLLIDIKQFENIIFAKYAKKPILYVTQEFYAAFLQNEFKDNPIWIRNIYKKPKLSDKRKWIFWQYSNRGHISGIDEYVDLNVFNGTEKEYLKLIK